MADLEVYKNLNPEKGKHLVLVEGHADRCRGPGVLVWFPARLQVPSQPPETADLGMQGRGSEAEAVCSLGEP